MMKRFLWFLLVGFSVPLVYAVDPVVDNATVNAIRALQTRSFTIVADTGLRTWDDGLNDEDNGQSITRVMLSGPLYKNSSTHFWYAAAVSGTYSTGGDGEASHIQRDFSATFTPSGLASAVLSGTAARNFSLYPFSAGGVSGLPARIGITVYAELKGKDWKGWNILDGDVYEWEQWDDSTVLQGDLDAAPPTFSLTSTVVDQWLNTPVPWTVSIVGAADLESGVAGAKYQVDGGPWQDIAPNGSISPTVGEGVHTVSVILYDRVGNISAVKSASYRLDTAAPSSANPTLGLSGSASAGLTVTASWTAASDAASGVKEYEVFWDQGTGTESGSVVVPASVTTASMPVAYRGPTPYRVRVVARDNAGNETSSAVAALTVPASLVFAAAPVVVLEPDGYRVGLTLSATPAELRQYGSVTLRRESADPARPLPASLTAAPLSWSTADIVDGAGQLVDPQRWSVDPSGRAVYTDEIAAATGAAHKSVRYTVSTTIAGVSDIVAGAAATLFPNHKGGLTLAILDMAGRPSTAPDFALFADGKAQLSLRGTDADLDHWELEVNRVLTTGNAGSGQLTGLKKLSGPGTLPYDPVSGEYPELRIPITLTSGITNVQAFWQEAGDAASSYSSDVQSITATLNPSTGLFAITVTDGYANPANSDSVGVLARPGEPLQFSVGAPGLSDAQILWQWDADNPADVSQGASPPAHAFGQRPGQAGDTAQYLVTVTLAADPVPAQLHMTVTIQDTQEGTLFVPETWNGAHTVTGVVVVPAGQTLTVNGEVELQGGLGAGFGQGLDVRGALAVGDDAVFRRAAGQTSPWGTILVEGSAQFGAADIQGALRGISVAPGGSAALAGTWLHGNRVGLHVVGSPSVTLSGASVTGNTLYGIKEDAGGRPALTGTAVSGNYYNYYSFDQGPLTIDQINALNTSPNNTGDTTWGTAE